MTTSNLEEVYARTRAGHAQVLRTEAAQQLSQRLLLRVNGYSPLERLLTREEQQQALAAVDELVSQGWIEPVDHDPSAPIASQWGALGGLDPIA